MYIRTTLAEPPPTRNYTQPCAAVRARYAREEAALMALRSREQPASGRPATAPPTNCTASH
jgi:hypothetical protein